MIGIVVWSVLCAFTVTTQSVPLSSSKSAGTRTTAPPLRLTSNVLNDGSGEVNGGPVDESVVLRVVREFCGWDGDTTGLKGDGAVVLGRFWNLTRGICGEGTGGDVGGNDMASEEANTQSEPLRQVIFVEVPVPKVEVVYNRPPPQTVVYVMPPEEEHVYKIFDMTRNGGRYEEPRVHFLSDFR